MTGRQVEQIRGSAFEAHTRSHQKDSVSHESAIRGPSSGIEQDLRQALLQQWVTGLTSVRTCRMDQIPDVPFWNDTRRLYRPCEQIQARFSCSSPVCRTSARESSKRDAQPNSRRAPELHLRVLVQELGFALRIPATFSYQALYNTRLPFHTHKRTPFTAGRRPFLDCDHIRDIRDILSDPPFSVLGGKR
jgi:hypothetical protein